jgi:exonuclease I
VFVCDTLPAFRKQTKESELKDHKLTTLANFTKVKFENAHDALSDSQALKEICEQFVKDKEIDLNGFLTQYRKPTEHFLKLEIERLEKDGKRST